MWAGIYGVLGFFSWLVLVVVVYASWTTPAKWGMVLLTVAFLGALFGWVSMVGTIVEPEGVMVLVRARQHDRKKKTLHFFDERAYLSVKDFEREFNEFLVLWQQRRHDSPADLPDG